MSKKYIIIILVILIAGVAGWYFLGSGGQFSKNTRGVEGEPLEVTLGFYEAWLNAKQSTSTDPFASGLLDRMELSPEMIDKLSETKDSMQEGDKDPVICMTTVPEGLRTIPAYVKEDSAQYIVRAGDKDIVGQAVVSLEANNGLWQITDINCNSGEEAPDTGEYNFDKTGQLLNNVPPPLDPQYWHLVFEENGVFGHTAPLLLDGESMCITDGNEAVCDAGSFTETAKVHVQGNMQEVGLEVKRIEFIN